MSVLEARIFLLDVVKNVSFAFEAMVCVGIIPLPVAFIFMLSGFKTIQWSSERYAILYLIFS